jgi:hypothetical protein
MYEGVAEELMVMPRRSTQDSAMGFEEFCETLWRLIDRYGVVTGARLAAATPEIHETTRWRWLRKLMDAGLLEASGTSSGRFYFRPGMRPKTESQGTDKR